MNDQPSPRRILRRAAYAGVGITAAGIALTTGLIVGVTQTAAAEKSTKSSTSNSSNSSTSSDTSGTTSSTSTSSTSSSSDSGITSSQQGSNNVGGSNGS